MDVAGLYTAAPHGRGSVCGFGRSPFTFGEPGGATCAPARLTRRLWYGGNGRCEVKQALDALRERPEALEGVDAADAGALAAVALDLGIELDAEASGQIAAPIAQASGAEGEIDDAALAGVAGGIAWGEVIDRVIGGLA